MWNYFVLNLGMKKTKTLKVRCNLINKIDGVSSSILFLLHESVPNTINLVDYRTPSNPGHIRGESKG